MLLPRASCTRTSTVAAIAERAIGNATAGASTNRRKGRMATRNARIVRSHPERSAMRFAMPGRAPLIVILVAAATALRAEASDAWQWSGFALLRGAAHDDATRTEGVFVGDVPLDDDLFSAQLQ